MLAEDRPGDLALAWKALQARGKGWRQPVVAATKRLDAETREMVGSEIPQLSAT